jgi:glutathione synthase/RimK-type ligase-like ATP-grasp enzyme
MILLAGIPTESPLARVRQALETLGVPFVLFHQRHFASIQMQVEVAGGRVGGRLVIDGCVWPLEQFRGVYVRLMDDRMLPELRDEPEGSALRRYCRWLHDALMQWCELTPARVVNRTAPMASNSSKPYQAQLIAGQGLEVPETLITNDPAEVLAFRQRHGRLVFKSISGVRSIVQTLEGEHLERLESVRACPVQFQQFIEGPNVRVHVVGRQVFATEARTEATDYRYAGSQVGEGAELRAVELPEELKARCQSLGQAMGLAFSGIDLKITPEGKVYCFEVNPSPAYSYYEANTGQPIALAVARYLAGIEDET